MDTLPARTFSACASICTFIWACAWIQLHANMAVCLGLIVMCVCVCVCVCVRVCVCGACRGRPNEDTVLFCVRQAGRQTLCQFFWNWAGLQLVMKWSQHVVKADIYHLLVTAASWIHTETVPPRRVCTLHTTDTYLSTRSICLMQRHRLDILIKNIPKWVEITADVASKYYYSHHLYIT